MTINPSNIACNNLVGCVIKLRANCLLIREPIKRGEKGRKTPKCATKQGIFQVNRPSHQLTEPDFPHDGVCLIGFLNAFRKKSKVVHLQYVTFKMVKIQEKRYWLSLFLGKNLSKNHLSEEFLCCMVSFAFFIQRGHCKMIHATFPMNVLEKWSSYMTHAFWVRNSFRTRLKFREQQIKSEFCSIL